MPRDNKAMESYIEDLQRIEYRRDRRALLVRISEQADALERSLQSYGVDEAREVFRKAGDISCWADMRLEELDGD